MQLTSIIKKSKKSSLKSRQVTFSDTRNQRQKIWLNVGQKDQPIFIMLLISLFFFGAIASRLAYIQLVEGNTYQEKAENNRTKILPKPPRQR